MDYSKKTVAELKDICKERKITGISRKKKNVIINILNDYDASQNAKSESNLYPMMDKMTRIQKLLQHLSIDKIDHSSEIMKLHTLKDACVYCIINHIYTQQYGSIIEKFIRAKFNYTKNMAYNCNGDCSKDGKNYEVKVSLGGATHTKFNFVQIRPTHDYDIYLFTAYYLTYNNIQSEGEIYIFKIPKLAMIDIVVKFGGYAHGTVKEHGKITHESYNDNTKNKEYAIRPTINDNCWKALIPFRIIESVL